VTAPFEAAGRPLTAADTAAGLRLSALVGWNQTAEDWALMLSIGAGIGIAGPAGLVASGIALPLGPTVGWVSMILVDPEWRRRGFGRAMLEAAVAELERRRFAIGLDATEWGEPLYRRFGFAAVAQLSRMAVPAQSAAPPDPGIRAFAGADLAAVARLDAGASGFERRAILAYLAHSLPAAALVSTDAAGTVDGFVLGRPGRLAPMLGPIIAADADRARALLWQAAARLATTVILDVCERPDGLAAALRELGGTRQRGFTRMGLGSERVGRPARSLFAVAGPELG
jgi:GNAT superfamily N-acetyltransferase